MGFSNYQSVIHLACGSIYGEQRELSSNIRKIARGKDAGLPAELVEEQVVVA